MRRFLVPTLVLLCGVQNAGASLAPPTTPCPDPEREFVELTLAYLVRKGFIDARNLVAYRAPKRFGASDECAAPPSASVRAPASGVAGGS